MNQQPGRETGHPSLSSGPFETLEKSVVLRFEQMARLHPDRIAIQDHERAMTYRALNTAANALAAALPKTQDLGNSPVAFLLGHDISSIIALLAILKSGRPYLALHPANPADLLTLIVSSTTPACIISTRAYASLMELLQSAAGAAPGLYLEDLDLEAVSENPGIYVPPDSPFSIFFTSGTTGEPKGIVISHRFVIFCILRHLVEWQLSPDDRVSLFVSNSFSASWATLLDGLLSGGTVCLYDFKSHGPQEALDWIAAEQISLLRFTPAMLRTTFERAPADLVFPRLRIVTLSGEPARGSDAALIQAHTAGHCKVVNIFASTEAGVVATYTLEHGTVFTDDYLPAGFPIPGHEVMLLDEEGEPVPPGEPGEIVIRSRYLSSGYWNQPALTARRFRPDPRDPDVRILFTGDRGVWRADGALEFLGRKDAMVKIRGFRVETAAVESLLRQVPQVREAVVAARPSKHRPDQMQLIAYVVAAGEGALTSSDLRRSLSGRLPDYSIPSFFVFLDRLPLNVNGKVDRRALPEIPDRPDLSPADLPANPTEEKLAGIWTASLNMDRVSVHDNFFELGGDSLLVLTMILDVEKTMGRKVPQEFFKQPTLRNLAALLHQPETGQGQPAWQKSSSARPWKRRTSRLKRLLKSGRSLGALSYAIRRKSRYAGDAAFLFEWLLSRVALHLPFRKIRPLVLWLADRHWLWRTFYRRKYEMLMHLLDQLEIPAAHASTLFRTSFINNLMYKVIEAKSPFNDRSRSNGSQAPSAYFRSLRSLLDETPVNRLDDVFPVQGMQHLEDARRRNRGVILLTMHGTAANRSAARTLARRLGVEKIQIISHNEAIKPLRKGKLQWMSKDRIPSEVATPVYAEEAYRGQRLLLDGNIVLFMSDFGAVGPGRIHHLRVGDRQYAVKAGFAELALNTGAAVIPYFGRFTDDGRLLVEFLPPLDPGSGDREQQVLTLLEGYEDFLNGIMKSHPEMLNWGRIAKHFRQPQG